MGTAIVTGAARGLVRAICERLVADGFTVWGLDADEGLELVAGLAEGDDVVRLVGLVVAELEVQAFEVELA